MFEPSLSLSPLAPVLLALSDPARSTREILDTLEPVTPESVSLQENGNMFAELFEQSCYVMLKVRTMVKTACDLLDSVFMLVAATVLDLLPSSIRLAISWASTTATGVRPSTYGPRTLCSLLSFF